uniref:Elongation factor G n=1 Tax=Lygus hesperus TaxID=30085 RepID=A0A0A9Z164_LYGHE
MQRSLTVDDALTLRQIHLEGGDRVETHNSLKQDEETVSTHAPQSQVLNAEKQVHMYSINTKEQHSDAVVETVQVQQEEFRDKKTQVKVEEDEMMRQKNYDGTQPTTDNLCVEIGIDCQIGSTEIHFSEAETERLSLSSSSSSISELNE